MHIKHFFSEAHTHSNAYSKHYFFGGYVNATADITALQFKFSSGNIDTGKIISSTNILKILKKRRQKTKISGFIMGSE